MKERILQALKPKVLQYGFSSASIDSFADQIAQNIEEDAGDEAINANIDAVIPFFRLSQSEITRIVNSRVKDEPTPPKVDETAEGRVEEEEAEPTDKLDKMAQLIEKLNDRIDTLTQSEVTKTRKQKYQEEISGLPEAIRKSMERKFERMTFKDDSDFEAFLEEEAAEIPELIKLEAEERLASSGRPRIGGRASNKQASDKEVENIIKQLNI